VNEVRSVMLYVGLGCSLARLLLACMTVSQEPATADPFGQGTGRCSCMGDRSG